MRTALIRLAAGLALAAVLGDHTSVARAQCDEIQISGPSVRAFAGIAAAQYYAANITSNSTVTAKEAAAARAISAAQNLGWPHGVAPNVIADAFRPYEKVDEADLQTAREITARIGEVARTDMQDGATPSVSGSSSVASKTGLSSIFSMAVEHGAVQREDNGTSTTVSTTPYALFLLGNEDSDENFRERWYLRMLGVAGTFDLDESNSKGSGDFIADQLSAITTTIRPPWYSDDEWQLLERSTRSKAFYTDWNINVAGPMRKNAEALYEQTLKLYRDDPALGAELNQLISNGPPPGPINAALRRELVASTTQQNATDAVHGLLQKELCARVIEPIRNGTLKVTGTSGPAAIEAAVRSLRSYDAALDALAEAQARLERQPLVAFKHTWNRADEGSDYSDFTLAIDGQFQTFPTAPMTLLFNGTLALNHNPDDSDEQDTVRDFGVSGSLEQAFRNPLRIGRQAEEAQNMALAISGRFAHDEDVDANIGVIQARLTMPLVRGFSLVGALNYATRTETDSDDEVRVSGSIEFNGDKLASLNELDRLLKLVR